MNSKVLIVTTSSIFGPFATQEIAQAWLDNGHTVGACELYSIRECELGTPARADECGTRLQSIEEQTAAQRTGSKAARSAG